MTQRRENAGPVHRKIAALIALAATACTGFTEAETAPPIDGVIHAQAGSKISIQLKNGSYLSADSLTFHADSMIVFGYTSRVAVPTKDIQAIGKYGFQSAETMLLAGAIVGSIWVLGALCASIGA